MADRSGQPGLSSDRSGRAKAPSVRSGRTRVLLATGNLHKLREIAAMLTDAPFELVGLSDFPEIVLPPETGETFEENAILKARAGAQQSGLVCIADDSGLEVDALAGRPGVRSARFSGPGAADESNLQLVLNLMTDIPEGQRRARFVCAIAVCPVDGPVEVVRGICEGELIRAPRGANGFGYDPIFRIPGDGRTLAEFSPAEKNAISHRARAVAAALPLIRRAIGDDRR